MSHRLRSLALVSLLFVAGSVLAQPSPPQPRIVEGAARDQVGNDPVVNPSSSVRHPGIPAEALAESGRPREEETERETWAEARWSTSTLELPGNAKMTISVARRSILLVHANWPGQSDLTVTVTRGNTTLKAFQGAIEPGIGRVVAGQVKVPSAGDVVIGASGPGSPKITLYVGVVAAQ